MMHLKILLPYAVFLDTQAQKAVLETRNGSHGVLPHRRDFCASIEPGILLYTDAAGQEQCVAVDEGVAAKTGMELFVSVRHAVAGNNLQALDRSVKEQFKERKSRERDVQEAMMRMENAFMRQLAELHNE